MFQSTMIVSISNSNDIQQSYLISCALNATSSVNCSTSPHNVTDEGDIYWQTHVARALFTYVPPFIVVFGTIGNILSFLVSRRKSMRRCSVGFCLSVLAISDLTVLYCGITRNWTKEVFHWDVRNVHEGFCKLHRFVLYCALDYSAWILVTITVERFISVCYPFKASSLCTLSRTRKILVILVVAIALENIGVFFARGKEILPDGRVKQCGYPTELGRYYWTGVRPWCVIALYAVIPFSIMIFCSIRIVHRLQKARAEMAQLFSGAETNKLNQSPSRTRNTLQVPNGEGQRKMDPQSTSRLKTHIESYKMYSMTIMSVVVAVVFLCLVTPSHFEFFLEKYWDKRDALDYAKFRVIEAFTRTLLYTNHGINFVVYMASGRKFRREFRRMVLRKEEASASSQANSAVYQTLRMTGRTYIDRSPGCSPMLGGRRGVVI